MIWGFISSTIMFNSFFLFIMLIPTVFFDKPPCPISLSTLLYPSHWQLPLTDPRQTRQPPFPLRCRPSLAYISSFPTKLPHKSTYPTSPPLQSRFTIPLTAILLEFLYPWLLIPNTGKIPDKIIICSSSSVDSCTGVFLHYRCCSFLVCVFRLDVNQ